MPDSDTIEFRDLEPLDTLTTKLYDVNNLLTKSMFLEHSILKADSTSEPEALFVDTNSVIGRTTDKITTIAMSDVPLGGALAVQNSEGNVNALVNQGGGSGLNADLLDDRHASVTNVSNTIVARDASGNFSAGTITANLSGRASLATNADNATHANEANHANEADHANESDYANEANSANTANTATSAANAEYANSSGYANSAGNANTVGNYSPSATPEANVIPVSDDDKHLDSWLSFSPTATPAANSVPKSGSSSTLVNGWLNDSIREYEHAIDTIAYYTEHETDYELAVGEVAKISFSDSSSIPLRIKCATGRMYKFSFTHYAPWTDNTKMGNSISYLYPNNTTYSSAFVTAYGAAAVFSADAFVLMTTTFSMVEGIIDMVNVSSKKVSAATVCGFLYNGSSYYGNSGLIANIWNDTTTSWTSLGTVTLATATSGSILVRRLV